MGGYFHVLIAYTLGKNQNYLLLRRLDVESVMKHKNENEVEQTGTG
jgi:hypothetical protein